MGAYVFHSAQARLPKGPETDAFVESVSATSDFEFEDRGDHVLMTLEFDDSTSYGHAGFMSDALDRAGALALEPFEDEWSYEDERGTEWYGPPDLVARKESELALAEIGRLFAVLHEDHAAEARDLFASVRVPRAPAP